MMKTTALIVIITVNNRDTHTTSVSEPHFECMNSEAQAVTQPPLQSGEEKQYFWNPQDFYILILFQCNSEKKMAFLIVLAFTRQVDQFLHMCGRSSYEHDRLLWSWRCEDGQHRRNEECVSVSRVQNKVIALEKGGKKNYFHEAERILDFPLLFREGFNKTVKVDMEIENR